VMVKGAKVIVKETKETCFSLPFLLERDDSGYSVVTYVNGKYIYRNVMREGQVINERELKPKEVKDFIKEALMLRYDQETASH